MKLHSFISYVKYDQCIRDGVFMAGKNYFINGITELLILSLLKERDMYVYEIVKAVENYSDGLLSISQNTLYTSTYKLINEGKLSEYSKLVGKRRTRVYYHIEPSGLDYLTELEDNYQRNISGVQTIKTAIENGVIKAEAPARDYVLEEEDATLNCSLLSEKLQLEPC